MTGLTKGNIKYLTKQQTDLLIKLKRDLDKDDRSIINSIIKDLSK